MISLPVSFRRLVCALVVLLTPAAALAQNQKKKQADAPPAAAKQAPQPTIDPAQPFIPPGMFALADDMEVTLWARTPLFRNPSNMDIDAQGRVWLAEAYNYRRHNGKDPEGDRIMIIEDSNGDGVAEKSSVFVQEKALLAPLGVSVIDNKIYVANTPDLIVYTDVNRDGKFDPAVDKREVLLTGFDGRNHDHSLHSVTFGPDGKYYFNHGNCGAYFTDKSGKTFRVGSFYDGGKSGGGIPISERRPPEFSGEKSDDGHVWVGGTAYRMNPDGTNVEPIGHNFRNSYEQTVTSFGDVFQNDNDDPPASAHHLPASNTATSASPPSTVNALGAPIAVPASPSPTAEWRQDDPGHHSRWRCLRRRFAHGYRVSYEGDAFGEKWRGLHSSAAETSAATWSSAISQKPKAPATSLERFPTSSLRIKKKNLAGVDFKGGIKLRQLRGFKNLLPPV